MGKEKARAGGRAVVGMSIFCLRRPNSGVATSSWGLVLFAYICFLNPLFESTLSTTSRAFCDLHKAPAQICSRKG
jgi:hypothetical protein